MKTWPRKRLGDVLDCISRPVEVQPDTFYREIGIRAHGKGVFHKEPILGFDLGDKRVFWVEPGDFVLSIVFAWEGAVALLGEAEAGMIASHRFPTYRLDQSQLSPRFLLAYLRTREGQEFLQQISPGGAGRNRTLSKKGFLELRIPMPGVPEQERIADVLDELKEEIDALKCLQKQAAAELEALFPSILDKAFKGEL